MHKILNGNYYCSFLRFAVSVMISAKIVLHMASIKLYAHACTSLMEKTVKRNALVISIQTLKEKNVSNVRMSAEDVLVHQ